MNNQLTIQPTTELQKNAADYFSHYVGIPLDALLAPIDDLFPTGKSMRSTGLYGAIEKERRQDDATLPMGTWEHELKRANWDNVSALALDTLQNKSKDMQLVAWLMEAQINLRGIRGVPACLVLMDNLCVLYWDHIYPMAIDGDVEYRTNIVRWMSEKLLPVLRLSPLINYGDNQYCWSDFEHARRNEQIKSSNEAAEGITWPEINHAINATSNESYLQLHQSLTLALEAIAALTGTLDRLCNDQSPSMGGMKGMLQQILSFVESELYKRGALPTQQQALIVLGAGAAAEQVSTIQSEPGNGTIRDRADAYARLAESAEFLMRLEPHSPVPYLVKRATEWGRLNTVELYQELFLKLGGQLNIFEMLGLQEQEKAS